jgi:hypothetical protein
MGAGFLPLAYNKENPGKSSNINIYILKLLGTKKGKKTDIFSFFLLIQDKKVTHRDVMSCLL